MPTWIPSGGGHQSEHAQPRALDLQHLLRYLEEQDGRSAPRMLLVEPLDEADMPAADVPVEHCAACCRRSRLDMAISVHGGIRRTGRDGPWPGSCSCCIRVCAPGRCAACASSTSNGNARRVRIEQSKGLKDRYGLPQPGCHPGAAGLPGGARAAGALPEQVFIYRHQPLSKSYCGSGCSTYGRRCGVNATPHQLRHSCATLLLNAGAPVLTVQTIAGPQVGGHHPGLRPPV